MHKRILSFVVVVLITGLLPATAGAKRPSPPEPPTWPPCEFDGTTLTYPGGGYGCWWDAGAGTAWEITVTPQPEAQQIVVVVKDTWPGDVCATVMRYMPTQTAAVSGTVTLPADGECDDGVDPAYDTGDPDEFYLWVTSRVDKKTQPPTVTFEPLP